MEGFVQWVGEPEAYNWITLVAAIAALLTAVFTGYTALLAHISRKAGISAEWEIGGIYDRPVITCHVRNWTTETLKAHQVDVRGPISNVLSWSGGRPQSKHGSWPPKRAPISATIDPMGEGSVSFIVQPDPSGFRSEASSWRARLRGDVARLSWKLFKWQVPFGVKLRISLMLRRRSSAIRPILLTHTIRIYPDRAMKMAETIENSAGSK